ncbi:hypothetical protein NE865_11194 [Phthorimaea operculella]|nr:hypothetical protein NE865_11194 [Phthorimaea operculella]
MFTRKIGKECQSIPPDKRGKVFDRYSQICAAGKPTGQIHDAIRTNLQQYQLEDEVNALLSDAIIPPPPPRKLAPTRIPIVPDQRHAGIYNEVKSIISPPTPTKFQELVTELKNTVYKSYWKTPLAERPDIKPMFPNDFDATFTTFGKKNVVEGSLYDLIMPKDPLPDKTPKSKEPSTKTDRNYCRPAFNPDLNYGCRTRVDRRGCYVRSCMTDPRILNGTANCSAISSIDAQVRLLKHPTIGTASTPNNNINLVPKNYSFGKVVPSDNIGDCQTLCPINPNLYKFRKCLAHLNNLRIIISKRCPASFFAKLHMTLKFEDKDKTGWVPKDTVYKICVKHQIPFDPSLIEPLLVLWEAFDGSNINYEVFTHIINLEHGIPTLPKIQDVYEDCIDYRTTYSEMVKPGQDRDDGPRAGAPSGRYFDLDYPVTPDQYCRAHRVCLSHESDMKTCLYPSIFTLMHVNHRDMYARREPDVVRRVFEAAGEEFTDEKFNKVWEEAKNHHSQGWVCYETFRRSLEQLFPC